MKGLRALACQANGLNRPERGRQHGINGRTEALHSLRVRSHSSGGCLVRLTQTLVRHKCMCVCVRQGLGVHHSSVPRQLEGVWLGLKSGAV